MSIKLQEYFVTNLDQTWGISIWARDTIHVTHALRAMFGPELECSAWDNIIWVGNFGFQIAKERNCGT